MARIKSLLMSAKNRDYDPMSEDGYDSKIPLHNDEAFQHGIQFGAKFIGSLDVAKPASRVEIVAAMRRIRYEFKAKSVKKRKVHLTIAVDGIKVCLSKKKKKDLYFDESKILIMQYPIYRVFYVSHDSQDLKIFSFIARDNVNNAFRCSVFKAYKKNEAMHIVRTIGQAFEVCHKLALQQRQQQTSVPQTSNTTKVPVEQQKSNDKNIHRETLAPNMDPMEKAERYLQSVQVQALTNNDKPSSLSPFHSLSSGIATSEFTLKHQMQFMQEQLQQMQSESDLTFNRLKVLQEQLNIEMNARIDAQNKNTQLLQRNRELLTHIQQLLLYTNELEMKVKMNGEPSKNLPSRPTDLLLLPSLFSTLTSSASSAATSNQQAPSSDSPDSGKGKEISSESISDPFVSSLTTDAQMTPMSTSWNYNSNNNNNNNNNLTNNSTKTFSMHDNLTTQSISRHDGAYSSTSPSLASSRSSCASLTHTHSSKKQTCLQHEPIYFEPLSTSTSAGVVEHYLYDHMTVPVSSSTTSFTNSGFAQSPLRRSALLATAKEFDPLMK